MTKGARGARAATVAVCLGLLGYLALSTQPQQGAYIQTEGDTVGFFEGTTDHFDRRNRTDGLGRTSQIQWLEGSGVWGVAQEAAYGAALDVAVTYVRSDLPVTGLQVRMKEVTDLAGLVVSYEDPDNFIALLAAPSYGTWAFWAREDGQWRYDHNVGLAIATAGVTVGAEFSGGSVRAVVNGTAVGTPMPVPEPVRAVGLVASGVESAVARFDDVVIRTGP